ncbi:MAG: DHH family phosphoesterase, partial [Clostridia bacterium]
LTDENRTIADYGISKMSRNPNPGLGAVLEIVGTGSKWNNSAVVSYSVAPRLNAAGRMSSAMIAVDLLLTEDKNEANRLASLLDEENRRRQREESVIFSEASEMIKKGDCFGKKVLVLAKRGWHHGIIGVVASRICDKFNKSCILISIEEGRCKSSGRSVEGMNLFDALSDCSDILEKFGGHAYAAGFSIKEENIPELDRRLNAFADKIFEKEPVPKLYIDAKIDVSDLTLETVRKTEILCPYGAGNKMPTFALTEIKICDLRSLSEGKHCRLICERGGQRIEVIAFGMGNITVEYSIGDVVDIAGEMNINFYNGTERVQLVLSAIRLSRRRPGDVLPSREEFADIYRYIKFLPQPVCAEATALANEISVNVRRRIKREKLLNALAVFSDVGIIKLGILGDTVKIYVPKTQSGKKVNLDSSKEYIRIKNELENQ